MPFKALTQEEFYDLLDPDDLATVKQLINAANPKSDFETFELPDDIKERVMSKLRKKYNLSDNAVIETKTQSYAQNRFTDLAIELASALHDKDGLVKRKIFRICLTITESIISPLDVDTIRNADSQNKKDIDHLYNVCATFCRAYNTVKLDDGQS